MTQAWGGKFIRRGGWQDDSGRNEQAGLENSAASGGSVEVTDGQRELIR
jgi:hypothetical protein